MTDEVEEIVITLTDEETGESKDYFLVEYLEVDEKEYAVFMPDDEEDDLAIVLRVEGEDFVDIEDEEEYEKVIKAIEEQELLDEEDLEDEEREV